MLRRVRVPAASCQAAIVPVVGALFMQPTRGFSYTPVRLLTPKVKKDPNKPWTQFDRVGFDADDDYFSEKDIFEDPSAAGRFGDDVEELSVEEIDSRIQLSVASYDPAMYGYLIVASVDLVWVLQEANLLPRVRPDLAILKWFGDPTLVLREPKTVKEWMGKPVWMTFKGEVASLVKDYEKVSPLCRLVRRRGLPEEIWVPFLRSLTLTILDRGKEGMEHVANLIVSLANGRGPPSLNLPEEFKDRLVLVVDLLIAAAQESGNSWLAFSAVSLQQAHQTDVTFPQQKALMAVFSQTTRRKLDWDLRTCGQLISASQDWLGPYFKLVREHHDHASELHTLKSMETVYDRINENTEEEPLAPQDRDDAPLQQQGLEESTNAEAGEGEEDEDEGAEMVENVDSEAGNSANTTFAPVEGEVSHYFGGRNATDADDGESRASLLRESIESMTAERSRKAEVEQEQAHLAALEEEAEELSADEPTIVDEPIDAAPADSDELTSGDALDVDDNVDDEDTALLSTKAVKKQRTTKKENAKKTAKTTAAAASKQKNKKVPTASAAAPKKGSEKKKKPSSTIKAGKGPVKKAKTTPSAKTKKKSK